MGYMRHHAIIVTDVPEPHGAVGSAHVEATRLFGGMVSPLIDSPVNGYASFFVAPDGSKEGWGSQEVRAGPHQEGYSHLPRVPEGVHSRLSKKGSPMSDPQKVKRWVVTSIERSTGLRTLTFPMQGRYTYDTKEEAERMMKLFAPGLRRQVLGDRADTLEVRETDCWAGHHDPVGIYFD